MGRTVKLEPGAQQVSTVTAHVETRQANMTGRPISDAAARTVAGWWQAPAGTGAVLSALQHGFPVDVDDLHDDIRATMQEAGESADRVALRMLGQWADHRADA